MNESIKKAIEICGSQSALARACGVSQPTVNLWLKGGEYSAKYAVRIERAVGGAITAQELCCELDRNTQGKKT